MDAYKREQRNLWEQPGLEERNALVKQRVQHMQGGSKNLLHHSQ